MIRHINTQTKERERIDIEQTKRFEYRKKTVKDIYKIMRRKMMVLTLERRKRPF